MTDIVTAEGTFRLADVFSRAFAVYGRRFVPFLIITVIASIPNYVALFALPMPVLTSPPNADTVLAFGNTRMALGLVAFLTTSLANGAVIYGVVQELRGRAFSVGNSILAALRRLLPMFGVTICVGIVIGLGAMLLLVPGIILACMYLLSIQTCVAERAGVFTSMSRSRFLTKGHRWQLFGILLLVLVAAIILNVVFGLLFSLGHPDRTFETVIGTQAASAILGSFNGVLFSVIYYQLRVAKEGVDIEKIASVFD
jgi:hypothetical protein